MHLDHNSDSEYFADLQRKYWKGEFLSAKELRIMDSLRKSLEIIVVQRSDVIFSTLDSSVKNTLDGIGVDSLIIDEATLTVEASTVIPFTHHPKSLILVGDQKQLGPPPKFDQLRSQGFYTSLFERIINLGYKHSILLDSQYRMHPDISLFPNMAFYDSLLVDMVSREERPIVPMKIKTHVNFFNVDGKEEKAGTSFYNEDEAHVVYSIVKYLLLNKIYNSLV